MVRACWVISVAMLLIAGANADAQGTLQRARDAVHPAPASDPAASSTGAGSAVGGFLGSVFDGETDIFTGTATVGLVALAPFIGPLLLVEDGYESRMFFSLHPYAGTQRGYLMHSRDNAVRFNDDADAKEILRKLWAVRLTLENGNDFRGLNRFGAAVKIDTADRIGIVTTWHYFRERLGCGCVDECLIGDTNVTFRFAQNEAASFYAGAGLRVFSDRWRTEYGFNFTYGGDWFPMRPFVVSGVFDAGNLGSAGVIHFRGTLGATWRGWEVFAGYDFLRIGAANLQGPMAGVRWWF
ncbi:MAG: hypothetical protein HYR84_08615 [Planctomycetes bacterium]|nr:hypothetical protein [Planctomycetota bacterium]